MSPFDQLKADAQTARDLAKKMGAAIEPVNLLAIFDKILGFLDFLRDHFNILVVGGWENLNILDKLLRIREAAEKFQKEEKTVEDAFKVLEASAAKMSSAAELAEALSAMHQLWTVAEGADSMTRLAGEVRRQTISAPKVLTRPIFKPILVEVEIESHQFLLFVETRVGEDGQAEVVAHFDDRILEIDEFEVESWQLTGAVEIKDGPFSNGRSKRIVFSAVREGIGMFEVSIRYKSQVYSSPKHTIEILPARRENPERFLFIEPPPEQVVREEIIKEPLPLEEKVKIVKERPVSLY